MERLYELMAINQMFFRFFLLKFWIIFFWNKIKKIFNKKWKNMSFENEKKWTFLWKIIKLIILFFIVFWVYFYINYNWFKNNELIENDFIIKIEAWDNFYNLWNKIIELDNIYYWYYIKNNKPSYELQAWSYKINGWSNIEQVIESLNNPITDEMNITILEGWNIYDIDESLNKKWLINAWEYIDYVTNKEKISSLSEFFPFIQNQITLEWFLYPDTYSVNISDFKINIFVIKQLETFEVKVYNKILKKLDNETINDLINLASIVEKEERNNDEKPTVAWILKKRLNDDWMIWADITVCYPYKLTSEQCKMVISKYINEKNDYNTRTMIWLPKTPIWNPSYETVNATLNDKETPYWFYLHNVKTWKIYYAETNAEHEVNKANYMY